MSFIDQYTRRVLACGSRDWTDEGAVWRVLDADLADHDPLTYLLVQGDAPGADLAAKTWAEERQIDHMSFPAKWRLLGRAAGPVRNRRQLTLELHVVFAFHDDLPNSRGTKDMVKKAESASVPVRKFRHQSREKRS